MRKKIRLRIVGAATLFFLLMCIPTSSAVIILGDYDWGSYIIADGNQMHMHTKGFYDFYGNYYPPVDVYIETFGDCYVLVDGQMILPIIPPQ